METRKGGVKAPLGAPGTHHTRNPVSQSITDLILILVGRPGNHDHDRDHDYLSAPAPGPSDHRTVT